jgi:hypothetical protein
MVSQDALDDYWAEGVLDEIYPRLSLELQNWLAGYSGRDCVVCLVEAFEYAPDLFTIEHVSRLEEIGKRFNPPSQRIIIDRAIANYRALAA